MGKINQWSRLLFGQPLTSAAAKLSDRLISVATTESFGEGSMANMQAEGSYSDWLFFHDECRRSLLQEPYRPPGGEDRVVQKCCGSSGSANGQAGDESETSGFGFAMAAVPIANRSG